MNKSKTKIGKEKNPKGMGSKYLTAV